jgi:hypothetical protein
MKHLKPFFEAVSGWDNINVGELKDFVNNSHFAYLVDEGFTIDVFSRINGTQFTDDQYFDTFTFIRIIKVERGSKVLFNWNDIKDSFTSFLESFIRRYNLSDTRLKLDFSVETHSVSGTTGYNLSDIMEDRIKSDWPIKYISIKK